jgi:hypothetical protein
MSTVAGKLHRGEEEAAGTLEVGAEARAEKRLARWAV